jgi:hypothetical protein
MHTTPVPRPELIALRVTIAEQDLREADTVNLASATPSELISLVEKLSGALSDMVSLHHERSRTERS